MITSVVALLVKNLLENRLFSFTLQRDFRSLKYFQETEIPSYSSPGKHWKVAQEKIPEKNLPLFSMNRRLTIERPDHKFNTYLTLVTPKTGWLKYMCINQCIEYRFVNWFDIFARRFSKPSLLRGLESFSLTLALAFLEIMKFITLKPRKMWQKLIF